MEFLKACGIFFLMIAFSFLVAYAWMLWYEKREYKRMLESRGSYLNDGIWGSEKIK